MTTPQLNRRLTSEDASFLYLERPTQPMHVGSCLVYEGRIRRDDVLRVLQERIHLLPRYRQRVVFPPFGIAHPTWEDDPDFDLGNHVEERTLPAPGDDETLSRFGGEIFAQVLPRERPLWKIVLLHRRADGNTAVIMMVHHAMVDGVSGVDLMLVVSDLKPHAAPPPPAQPWSPQPLPDAITRWQDAVRDQLTQMARAWTDLSFRALRPTQAVDQMQRLTELSGTMLPQVLNTAPTTPFNGPLSAQRQFAWAEFNFSEFRFVRSTLGGTVNDVVLAVLSGALGRYLHAHGMATDGLVLRAMCPVSMRRAEERGQLGNLVSIMIAPLYVGVGDPIERLNAERAAMERLKQEGQANGIYELVEFANLVPAAVQSFALGFAAPNTLLNTVSTNVPGPQIPLYLAGHQLLDWYPLGPCASSIGLFNAILSYNQKLTFGATVDPTLVPDVWFFVSCLKDAFRELLSAAEQRSGRTTTTAPAVAKAAQTPTRSHHRRKQEAASAD